MKKPAAIVLFFFFGWVAMVSAQVANFEGSWKLNRAKSEGLTGGLGNADLLLEVAQTPRELTVDQKTRIRGKVQPSQPLTYRLDGKESTAEVSRPLAGTMELEAKVLSKGKTLELKSTISGDDQGKPVTIITKEYWELVDGGKGLKIQRIRESSGKSQQWTLFFDKQ